MINRRSAGKNNGRMIENRYPLLAKIFRCNTFNLNKLAKIYLQIVLNRQVIVWRIPRVRLWL